MMDFDHGGWFAYLTPDGHFCNGAKGNAWKSFFHLPRYLLKCVDLMKSVKGDVK